MAARLSPPSAHAIAEAADLLAQGRLVGVPTETVYGLAADAASPGAVARLFAAKGRPRFNPLIIHINALEDAACEGRLDGRALALAERFWPGPLTLVAPRAETGRACDLACAGLATVALRIPAHETARAVIAAFGGPLAMPSANRSGGLTATDAHAVADELGEAVDLVLDAGPAPLGLESTVVGLAGPAPLLLRPGALPRGEIEAVIGPLAAPPASDAVQAPGMLARHYAPKHAKLRLEAAAPEPGEAYLGFGPQQPWATLNLSPSGDLVEAAATLFSALRALDGAGYAGIAVAPIPRQGLGEAINDRLARAAAG